MLRYGVSDIMPGSFCISYSIKCLYQRYNCLGNVNATGISQNHSAFLNTSGSISRSHIQIDVTVWPGNSSSHILTTKHRISLTYKNQNFEVSSNKPVALTTPGCTKCHVVRSMFSNGMLEVSVSGCLKESGFSGKAVCRT